MTLGMIPERTNVIGQIQCQRPFDFIRTEVGKLSVHAGEGLRLDVVLFQCQADSMLILDPTFLTGVGIPTIKLGEPSFPKAQFASLEPNGVGNIRTRWCSRRLEY